MKRHQSYAAPVRNGEPLVFLVGFRRLAVRAIFSAADIGVDKHKYERFLQRGADSVASFYAPVCVGPAPVLVLREQLSPHADAIDIDGRALVATGSLMSPDPDRIVLRKAVLTGVPVKCHKRKAVIAGMFHNAEDVEYFMPIELWTKYGKVGHITESLGTRGRMKVSFFVLVLVLSLVDSGYDICILVYFQWTCATKRHCLFEVSLLEFDFLQSFYLDVFFF